MLACEFRGKCPYWPLCQERTQFSGPAKSNLAGYGPFALSARQHGTSGIGPHFVVVNMRGALERQPKLARKVELAHIEIESDFVGADALAGSR